MTKPKTLREALDRMVKPESLHPEQERWEMLSVILRETMECDGTDIDLEIE